MAHPESSHYRGYAESGRAAAQRCRDLRESLVADERSVEIERIDVTPHAGSGSRVVELVMEVRVSDRAVRLRNAAVEIEGCWFLATLEPHAEPRAGTIGETLDGTAATRG